MYRGGVTASERYGSALAAELRVWIDQDLCTGDGICTDHAPSVFTILEDGIAYCKEGEKIFNDPGGSAELAAVPTQLEKDVIDAAAECPGECIFIEFAELPELAEGKSGPGPGPTAHVRSSAPPS